MENTVITPQEAVQFEEFKRTRREEEIAVRLKKSIVDASRRETDKRALAGALSLAKKYGAGAVLVSPVNVALASRIAEDTHIGVICLVGGTGESLPAVKKCEAKKAFSCGAGEIRLVLCYSQLTGGNLNYLKREIKKVRKAAKKRPVTVSLEDHALSPKEVALGVKAAREAKADGVCVRGELSLLSAATDNGPNLHIEVSGVENAEQFNSLLRAGASRVCTHAIETIAGELFREAENTVLRF